MYIDYSKDEIKLLVSLIPRPSELGREDLVHIICTYSITLRRILGHLIYTIQLLRIPILLFINEADRELVTSSPVSPHARIWALI